MLSLLVSEVMNPSVITVSDEAPLSEALELMQTHGISALVVVDHAGAMVGVISKTDLLRAWQSGTDYASAQHRPVSQFMTHDVVSCAAHKPLEYAMQTLNKHQIHRLVVVDTKDGGRFITDRMIPIGILSQTDIVRALLERADAAATSGDATKAIGTE